MSAAARMVTRREVELMKGQIPAMRKLLGEPPPWGDTATVMDGLLDTLLRAVELLEAIVDDPDETAAAITFLMDFER